jgi:CrcB protein
MHRIFYLFVGGGVGTIARYLTSLAAARLLSPSFPFGTLIVNVAGCFFIGFIHTSAMFSARVSPETRLFLTTGVMGGLTTYSTFNYEALVLFEQGALLRGLTYLSATLIGGIVAGVLGTWSARALLAIM